MEIPTTDYICPWTDIGYLRNSVRCVPFQIIEAGDGKYLLVISFESGRMEVISLASVMLTTLEGSMALGIALDREERYAYITNTKEDTVASGLEAGKR